MKTVVKTASEARIEFFDLINAAKHGGQVTVITKNGKVAAKIVPNAMPNPSQLSIDQLLKKTAGIFTDEDVKAAKAIRSDLNRRLRAR